MPTLGSVDWTVLVEPGAEDVEEVDFIVLVLEDFIVLELVLEDRVVVLVDLLELELRVVVEVLVGPLGVLDPCRHW